jgi:hypothetical protein
MESSDRKLKKRISFKLASSETSKPVSLHHKEDRSFRYEYSILAFRSAANRGSTFLPFRQALEFRLTGEKVRKKKNFVELPNTIDS